MEGTMPGLPPSALVPLWTQKGGQHLELLDNFMELITAIKLASLCIASTWPNISIVFLISSVMSHFGQAISRLYISQNFLKDFRPAHSQSAWPFESVIGNIQDTPSNWHLGMY